MDITELNDIVNEYYNRPKDTISVKLRKTHFGKEECISILKPNYEDYYGCFTQWDNFENVEWELKYPVRCPNCGVKEQYFFLEQCECGQNVFGYFAEYKKADVPRSCNTCKTASGFNGIKYWKRWCKRQMYVKCRGDRECYTKDPDAPPMELLKQADKVLSNATEEDILNAIHDKEFNM